MDSPLPHEELSAGVSRSAVLSLGSAVHQVTSPVASLPQFHQVRGRNPNEISNEGVRAVLSQQQAALGAMTLPSQAGPTVSAVPGCCQGLEAGTLSQLGPGCFTPRAPPMPGEPGQPWGQTSQCGGWEG